ncbi:nSTAND3 domain-containing NTPase [Acidithrix ferrooxidans]|uniref:nSTAND3 domain-containing NTPase n=1 Tax=Acidithrix ferrooxidans TaxID=1280514 RepID=UPI001269C661|nr:hypothetical protein [Acidithrix ferrooxidans]
MSPTILQFKHSSAADAHFSPSKLKLELDKVKKHVLEGRCEVYVLMTNFKVTGDSASEIQNLFKEIGVREVIIMGYEALCEILTEQKTLRSMVPRLYGLGDLSEILDERHYAQAEEILALMHDHLARLVPVRAHRAAAKALRNQRFALLIGKPGSGKTSIAASLAIGAMDLCDARPVMLSRIDDLHERWNPRDPNQLFWLDDGFGVTQYDSTTAEAWNRAASQIAAAIRGGARFIVTSRDYVYAAARRDLKISAFPLLEETRVVIEVESFSPEEREQILYNHLRLGNQQNEVLMSMSPIDLEEVAADASFLPEIARRLGEPLFTQGLRVSKLDSLLDFFRKPTAFLLEVLTNLDVASQAALGLVHLHSNHLPSPYVATDDDKEFLQRLGVSLGAVLRALPTLEGSFLRLTSVAGERWWKFQHPTFTDVYQGWIEKEPELLAEYIGSARLDDLIRTITCGNVGIKGAVVVPTSLWENVSARLIKIQSSSKLPRITVAWNDAVFQFIAKRCDREFLRLLINRKQTLVEEAFTIESSISGYTSKRLLARVLLDEGFAGDSDRVRLVESLTRKVVEEMGGSFFADEEWLGFFTEAELNELDRRVLEVLSDLDDWVRDELQDPEFGLAFADESVAGYESRYSGNLHVLEARRRIEEFTDYEPDVNSDAWEDEGLATMSAPSQAADLNRSIFEDLTFSRVG